MGNEQQDNSVCSCCYSSIGISGSGGAVGTALVLVVACGAAGAAVSNSGRAVCAGGSLKRNNDFDGPKDLFRRAGLSIGVQ